MKAIMISIKPKYFELIMNGEKTIEVRKNKALASAIQKLIDKNGYADIYVYCSKNGVDRNGMPTELVDYRGCVIYNRFQLMPKGSKATSDDEQPRLNGKVVFKFRCYKVEEWHNYSWQEITKNAYLTDDELRDYSKGVASLYCIHISDLEIFDKPKELSEFRHITHFRSYGSFRVDIEEQIMPLTKAPQNFCYVEVD